MNSGFNPEFASSNMEPSFMKTKEIYVAEWFCLTLTYMWVAGDSCKTDNKYIKYIFIHEHVMCS